MDETRVRAIIREEIALAFKTLAEAAWTSDPEDDISLERALSSFNSYAYRGAYEAADEEREQNAENPFEETDPDTGVPVETLAATHFSGLRQNQSAKPHVHRFEYADDGAGHSGSFCDCGAEEPAVENERRRIAHAAAYLPAVDLNALDAGAYKLLGNLARNDPYTNAVIRLVQHGGPRIGR